jgi:hypothetical protein
MSAMVAGCSISVGNTQTKVDKPVSDHYNKMRLLILVIFRMYAVSALSC